MNIQSLYSTKEREKILNYLLEHPNEKINMNRLAAKLNLSPGQIHKYITILRVHDMVKKYTLKKTPFVNALRLMHNLNRIENSHLLYNLKRNLRGEKGIGIFGTWSNGTNEEGSDLDIWIKIDKAPKDIEIANMRRKLELKIKAPIDITILTPERLKHFREKNDSLYFSLYHGVVLWGEGL